MIKSFMTVRDHRDPSLIAETVRSYSVTPLSYRRLQNYIFINEYLTLKINFILETNYVFSLIFIVNRNKELG